MNMDFRARMVFLRKMSKEAVLNNLLVLTQLRLKVPAGGGLPSEKKLLHPTGVGVVLGFIGGGDG